MQLGMIGLGKMGGNMARRLRRAGIDVVGYNRDTEATAALASECGLIAATSAEVLVERLDAPRRVWLMLPAGEVTESYIQQLRGLLGTGDIVIDGANSFYKDSVRRGRYLAEAGIGFVDAGVSGGIHGLDNGYSLMVGGSDDAVAAVQPALDALAPAADRGCVHAGAAGSGHFTKMIHNGIEYGMMQAYAEGFALLRGHPEFDVDLAAVAEAWRHGSVVRSWLLDLCADVLAADQELADIAPSVADSGEGRWTAMEAIEQGIPAPVMSLALMSRFASRGGQDYSSRLLAMMRERFGGHSVQANRKASGDPAK